MEKNDCTITYKITNVTNEEAEKLEMEIKRIALKHGASVDIKIFKTED